MKTTILITGDASGNKVLLTRLMTLESEDHQGFYGFKLIFPTKKAAKKALWEAYKDLRSDKADAKASMLSYSKYGALSYDASRAEIITNG